MNTVLFEQHGSIGIMTFNRPEVFNAMSVELIVAFRDVTADIMKSGTVRALIVRGAGKAFLAGGDVAHFYRERETVADTVKPLGDALHEGIIDRKSVV